MADQELINRGRAAATLLENDVFKEAMQRCAYQCQQALLASKPEETDLREQCYYQNRAVYAIEQMLRNFVEIGNREEKEDGDK